VPPGEPEPAQAEAAPDYPPHALTRKVWDNRVAGDQRLAANVGRRHRGATVRIVEAGELLHVYHGDELIHVAAPDHNSRYQRRSKRRRHLPETEGHGCAPAPRGVP
jgi:hypothetical protein